MSYTPNNADATNVRNRVTTQATSVTANATANNDTHLAVWDAVLDSIGYRGQSSAVAVGAVTKATGTWEDIGNGSSTGFSTYSFTAPVAKTYLVRADFTLYDANGTASVVFWRLDVDGVAYNPVFFPLHMVSGQHLQASFVAPVPMTAAAHTIKLQWNVFAGTGGVASTDGRVFTVTG